MTKIVSFYQQSNTPPPAIFCLSSSWFKLWEGFVTNRQRDPPGAIDNRAIITSTSNPRAVPSPAGSAGAGGSQQQPQMTLRQNSDYLQA